MNPCEDITDIPCLGIHNAQILKNVYLVVKNSEN